MNQVWNAIKTASRLKLGLANPYRISPQYCVLSKENPKAQAKFIQIKKINRNVSVARFQLPEEEKCLGLMIGESIGVNIGKAKHTFSPVSRIDEPGIIDVLISKKQSKSREFAQELQKLKQGNKVSLEERKSPYVYNGYGKLQWKSNQPQKFKHIGIIAFDASITKVYNLIDSIMPNYDSHTGVSLLWIGENHEQDFIFLEEFSLLAEQYKLNLNLMLKENKPGWIGPFGSLNSSYIKAYMPPPNSETALILCGTSSQVQPVNQIASQLGYKNVITPDDE